MSKFLDTAGLGVLRDWVLQKLGVKQDTLVSGTNIKTINNQSLLGNGDITISSGLQNLVDGSATGSVRGINTAAEDSTYTMGDYAFTEGNSTKASGSRAHAEGLGTTASGSSSHAEGHNTTASNNDSHAEGYNTTASGNTSHAEGNGTTASSSYSHAEGSQTIASGYMSHAQNDCTIAAKTAQTAIGKYNIEDTERTIANQKAFIIGNGTGNNNRSNAFTVDWQGNVEAAGTINDSQGDLRNLQTSYLKSPGGFVWKLVVDDSGNLTATMVDPD